MSSTYKISVPIQLILPEETINKLKSMKMSFTLLEILPKADMLDILKANLLKAGLKETEEGLSLDLTPRINASFDLEKLEAELNFNLPENQVYRSTADTALERSFLHEVTEAVIANKPISRLECNSLAEDFAKELADAAISFKSKINLAIKETYKDAVVLKARELGSIETLTESQSNGSYKIHIEIQS